MAKEEVLPEGVIHTIQYIDGRISDLGVQIARMEEGHHSLMKSHDELKDKLEAYLEKKDERRKEIDKKFSALDGKFASKNIEWIVKIMLGGSILWVVNNLLNLIPKVHALIQ